MRSIISIFTIFLSFNTFAAEVISPFRSVTAEEFYSEFSQVEYKEPEAGDVYYWHTIFYDNVPDLTQVSELVTSNDGVLSQEANECADEDRISGVCFDFSIKEQCQYKKEQDWVTLLQEDGILKSKRHKIFTLPYNEGRDIPCPSLVLVETHSEPFSFVSLAERKVAKWQFIAAIRNGDLEATITKGTSVLGKVVYKVQLGPEYQNYSFYYSNDIGQETPQHFMEVLGDQQRYGLYRYVYELK